VIADSQLDYFILCVVRAAQAGLTLSGVQPGRILIYIAC
jgi:hypothetical protein